MRTPKHIRAILREFPGATARPTRGGHWKICRDGLPVVFASSTPSDWRETANTRARLRRRVPAATIPLAP